MGFLKSMNTIIMLNICKVLPDMYIMIAFIGNALAGARANSHDFLIFRVSVSSVVGAFCDWVFEATERWFETSIDCSRRRYQRRILALPLEEAE